MKNSQKNEKLLKGTYTTQRAIYEEDLHVCFVPIMLSMFYVFISFQFLCA